MLQCLPPNISQFLRKDPTDVASDLISLAYGSGPELMATLHRMSWAMASIDELGKHLRVFCPLAAAAMKLGITEKEIIKVFIGSIKIGVLHDRLNFATKLGTSAVPKVSTFAEVQLLCLKELQTMLCYAPAPLSCVNSVKAIPCRDFLKTGSSVGNSSGNINGTHEHIRGVICLSR